MQGREPLPVLTRASLADAQRQLEICNACRYCEGLCPVFPALERRDSFGEPDVLFLANLCHDCQTCYHVCPYAPPHAFGVNIPLLMSEKRQQTYRSYAWPAALGRLFTRHRSALLLAVLASSAIALGAGLVNAGPAEMTSVQTGAGAFYRVIPWLWMFVPAMLLSAWAIVAAMIGVARFWNATGRRSVGELGRTQVLLGIAGAFRDALTLRRMDGGGPGCDYPDETPSPVRRRAHWLVFWGFGATFAATAVAFVKQELLGELPPYPWLSEPVVLGTVGGVAMIVGALVLLRLKEATRAGASATMDALDRTFLLVIVGLGVGGLGLLIARETAAMGILLAFHLALVGAFFVTAPYSKFIHFTYRISALVQDHLEARAETARDIAASL